MHITQHCCLLKRRVHRNLRLLKYRLFLLKQLNYGNKNNKKKTMPKTTTIVLHNIVKTTLLSLNGKALLYLDNIPNNLLYNSHLPFYLGDGRFHFKKQHFTYYTSLNSPQLLLNLNIKVYSISFKRCHSTIWHITEKDAFFIQ